MTIISTCPSCGAPIYGKARIKAGEEPTIKRTCACPVRVAAPPPPQPLILGPPWCERQPVIYGPGVRLPGDPDPWAPFMGSGQTSVREGPPYEFVINATSS